MKMIWHIIKKDLCAIRLVWIAWLGLFAVRIPLLAYYMNYAGERAFSVMSLMTALSIVVDSVVIFMLVGSVVHEDALVGDRAFWVTRPIKGVYLLLAKLVTLLFVCVISPLVLLVPTWLGFGLDTANICRVLTYHCMFTGGVLVCASLFAVVTQKGSTFSLVAITVLVGAGAIATVVESGLEIRLIRSNTLYWYAVCAGIGVLAYGIAQQYITRRVRNTWFVIIVLTIATGFLLPSLSGKILFRSRSPVTSIDQPLKIEWKDGKVVLPKKPEGCARGLIEIVSAKSYSSIKLQYLKGAWIGPDGGTQPAMLYEAKGGGRNDFIIDARSVARTSEGSVHRFPIILNAPLHAEEMQWNTVSFRGRLLAEYSQDCNVAEVDLSVGSKVTASNFFARILSVKTYENAVELSVLEVGEPQGQFGRLEVFALGQQKGFASMSWRESGMLFWLLFQRKGSVHVKSEMTPEALRKNQFGSETHESLAGWRVVWKKTQTIGYRHYDLKADQLTIIKGL